MSDTPLKLNDQLAIDRTRMAAERSLMAWVRTALSLIAFGFTIYKFLQAIQAQSQLPVYRPNAPRNIGLLLVGIGIFSIVVSCVQHRRYAKKLDTVLPDKPWDLAFFVAILIGLLGVVVFASMVYTSGPFS
jgi:putative membrane protein